MAKLHADTECGQCGNQCSVLADLGRQRHHPDRCQCVQLLHQRHGRLDRAVGLCAQPLRADEGAFQVHAGDAGRVGIGRGHRCRNALQRVLDLVQAGGHGGRQQRGGAEARMGAGDGAGHIAALHQVDAGRAMYVQVDETGQDHRQLRVIAAAVVVHLQLAHVRIELDLAATPAQRGEDAAVQGAGVGHAGGSAMITSMPSRCSPSRVASSMPASVMMAWI
ncbi:hypothetical protein D3C73_967250 [compost metagenome]